MRRTRWLVLLFLGLACSSGDTGTAVQPPPPPPPPPGGGNPSAGQVAMQSSDDGYGNAEHKFVPSSITVTRNGTVTWNNATSFTHNITFSAVQGAPANVADFTSGSATRSFTVAGAFTYRCTNHAGMQGQVIVQ